MAQGVRELVERIRSKTDQPVAVGFGISKPEHVREVCEFTDGAVVGSVLVSLIGARAGTETLLGDVHTLVSSLKSGARRR